MTRTVRANGMLRPIESLDLPDGISVIVTVEDLQDVDQATWDQFRALGRDARSGHLRNAAEEHDRYLYGNPGT